MLITLLLKNAFAQDMNRALVDLMGPEAQDPLLTAKLDNARLHQLLLSYCAWVPLCRFCLKDTLPCLKKTLVGHTLAPPPKNCADCCLPTACGSFCACSILCRTVLHCSASADYAQTHTPQEARHRRHTVAT